MGDNFKFIVKVQVSEIVDCLRFLYDICLCFLGEKLMFVSVFVSYKEKLFFFFDV